MNVTMDLSKLPYEAKVALANDEQASPEVLAALATDKDRRIRILVAWHSGTPSEVLDTLVNDCDSVVRRAVAENGNTFCKDFSKVGKRYRRRCSYGCWRK